MSDPTLLETPPTRKLPLYRRCNTLRRIDGMIPREILAGGNEWERRRARLIVSLSIASIIVPLVLYPLWSTGWTLHAKAVLLSFPLVGLLVLFGMRRGYPLTLLGNAHAALCYVGCMGLTIRMVGSATPALLTLIYLPLMALMLCGRKSGLAWAVAIAIGLAFTAWLESQGITPPADYVDVAWTENRFSIVGLLSFAVAVLGYAFASFQELAMRESELGWSAIATSEERYRALSENAGDIVTDFDEQLNLTYISPNCSEILGWSADGLLSRSSLEDLFHGDDFPKLVESVLFSRQFDEIRQMPVRFRHHDGHWIPLEVSFNSYRSRDGVMHTVAIARDVSELRAAEIASRHHERLASTGTLAAGMAHQINNPVGAILNGSEFALISLDEGDLDAVRVALQNNVEQARRCGNIVHGLLQFARQDPVKKRREDLTDIVSHSIRLTDSYARERGVQLLQHASRGDFTIEGNAVEIEQVLVNLLRNAVEASHEGGVIEVEIVGDRDCVVLEVCDAGQGVADGDLPHVFDPFFTTRIEDGGSGLGLSVAHGIVADHGGEMTLDSRSGQGTRVRVRLPLAPA